MKDKLAFIDGLTGTEAFHLELAIATEINHATLIAYARAACALCELCHEGYEPHQEYGSWAHGPDQTDRGVGFGPQECRADAVWRLANKVGPPSMFLPFWRKVLSEESKT